MNQTQYKKGISFSLLCHLSNDIIDMAIGRNFLGARTAYDLRFAYAN